MGWVLWVKEEEGVDGRGRRKVWLDEGEDGVCVFYLSYQNEDLDV